MHHWRRTAVAIAAAMAILAIAAVLALHAIGDPDKVKARLRAQLREAFSRDVAIGDASLSLLPLPSVHATDVTLGDAPGGKDSWHLHADRVVMGLELRSLLSDKPRVRDIRIEGDVSRHGQRLKLVADLDDISHYGEPDAVSDGKIELDGGKTHVSLSGRIPLQAQLRGAAIDARLESQSLNDLLAFFGVERPRPTAAARVHLEFRSTGERIEVLNVDATLGKLRVTGDARIATTGPRPVVDARVRTAQLDWAQALLDAGGTPVAPLPADELFYDHPIEWPLLLAMEGAQGTIDARLESLRLRNGVELRHFNADMAFDGDKLHLRKYTTQLLGGSGTGTMQLDGRNKAVRLHFEGTNLLLERWFKERRREIPFAGGPMAISASLSARGLSMRDLGHSMTGPVAIRMGPGVYASQKAGDAEAMMVAFSKKNSDGRITFECVGAQLPFVDGHATGDALVGARSDVSRLLTSGYVSMRDEAVDLHGRMRPKPGMGVGLAAIAGDIRITGKIRNMKVSLDPAGQARAVVRAGAAIATLGLSLAASAAANAAREDTDPCAAVFTKAPADR